MALAVSASSAGLAIGPVTSAFAAVEGAAPVPGNRSATSLAEREAVRAKKRLDNREERAADKELRLACRAQVTKEREAFNVRQARRLARFWMRQAARRSKFLLTHHTKSEREAFHAKLAKRNEQFKQRQQKRRETFDLRADTAAGRCGAIGASAVGAPTVGAANIYLGTINEADELGGEEILSEET
jgi:hypothetical protein